MRQTVLVNALCLTGAGQRLPSRKDILSLIKKEEKWVFSFIGGGTEQDSLVEGLNRKEAPALPLTPE